MPVSRKNIFVQPGLRTLLSVNLAGLFSSIQLVYPEAGDRSILSDDWKWVLRTSNATRPVLRILPGWKQDQRDEPSPLFADTRALVKVSAGDGGRVTSFGNESDLGTAFALATLMGRNQFQISGNVGYASHLGTPSAGFAARYSRDSSETLASPEVTVTMRQVYLPGRVTTTAPSTSSEPVLRTHSLGVKDSTHLSESMRLEYGFALDSVTLSERLSYFSPHARLIYSVSEGEEIEFSYTSGIPRSDMFLGAGSPDADLQNDISALALFPRISMRGSRGHVQQSRSFEAGYTRTVGDRSYSMAIFQEGVSNAALTIAGADGMFPAGDILPDLFTTTSVFNAGSYSSYGYMVAASQNLGENLKLTLAYGSGGALVAAGDTALSGGSPDELRAMIRQGRRRYLTPQVSGVSPWTGTQFTASYQFTDRRSVTPAHFYATQRARADAGLNIAVKQPIPAMPMIPIRMEASAEMRNLLAEGYMPFAMRDGRQVLLMHTPRSFRGGLSFIF
jgi:hypothetical protein